MAVPAATATATATASAAVPAATNHSRQQWSPEEHARYLEAVRLFPNAAWRVLAAHVGTRTTRQTMTHATKLALKHQRHARGLKVAGRRRRNHQEEDGVVPRRHRRAQSNGRRSDAPGAVVTTALDQPANGPRSGVVGTPTPVQARPNAPRVEATDAATTNVWRKKPYAHESDTMLTSPRQPSTHSNTPRNEGTGTVAARVCDQPYAQPHGLRCGATVTALADVCVQANAPSTAATGPVATHVWGRPHPQADGLRRRAVAAGPVAGTTFTEKSEAPSVVDFGALHRLAIVACSTSVSSGAHDAKAGHQANSTRFTDA